MTTITKEKEISLVSFDDDIYVTARKLEGEAFREMFDVLGYRNIDATVDVSINSYPNKPLRRIIKIKLRF